MQRTINAIEKLRNEYKERRVLEISKYLKFTPFLKKIMCVKLNRSIIIRKKLYEIHRYFQQFIVGKYLQCVITPELIKLVKGQKHSYETCQLF